MSFGHLARSRAFHHPMLGWRLESPGILWSSNKRLAFLDVLEHGQRNGEHDRTKKGGGCLATSAAMQGGLA